MNERVEVSKVERVTGNLLAVYAQLQSTGSAEGQAMIAEALDLLGLLDAAWMTADRQREQDKARYEEGIRKLKRERDLAIAHDRQPYPTAEAYEKVCKALEDHKAQLAKCRELVKALECTERRIHDPRLTGIVQLLDAALALDQRPAVEQIQRELP